MAHYTWNVATPLGNRLRTGLDDLRAAQHALQDTLGAMNQMTNQQIADAFGFVDATTAGAAKAEIASDVAATFVTAAQQMLDEFA